MYNVSVIEMYANWILDDIKTARKNHKKVNMKSLKSYGEHIIDLSKLTTEEYGSILPKKVVTDLDKNYPADKKQRSYRTNYC